ncbi:MAG: hypothetical protein RL145_27 [Pseudomonadota bacterium]
MILAKKKRSHQASGEKLMPASLMVLAASCLGGTANAQPPDGKDSVESSPDTETTIVVFGRGEGRIGIAQTASEGSLSGADLLVRPLLRTAELLEAVPGMVAAQHSGSGKANQYFLRGFNLDHGSDFTTYVDGVQMNLRSHGHGHGYLDLNGLSPDLVKREDYRKGPYRADTGDFSMAGTAFITTIDRLEAPWVAGERGSFGSRAFSAGGTVAGLGPGDLTVIGDVKSYDGPWAKDEHLRHFAGFAKYVAPTAKGSLAFSLQAYRGAWRPTEQIPERIIGSSVCPNVFCSPDPTAKGETTRYIANGRYTSPGLSGNVYVQRYNWRMSSNPTFTNADGSSAQISQFDRRWIFGLRLEGERALGSTMSLRLGTEAQLDDIGRVGVSTSDSGLVTGSLGAYTAAQGSASGWTEFTWTPVPPIRLFGGARSDWYGYKVRARDGAALALGEGSGSSALISPKFGAAIKIAEQLEIYANWGRGFHSNDVRGAVSSAPVPLLVQGTGEEIGSRLQLGNLTFTATYWWLGLNSELRFVGDSNSVEPTGASRRYGYELVAFWRPLPWLAIDGNFTASHSRYQSGEYIPNAFENAGQLGASLVFRHLELSVRWRHLGPYPLTEDNLVRESGSDVVNARASFKTGSFEFYGELLNLFASKDKDIAYFYESYVPAFDAQPVEGRMSRVVEPRTLRLGLKFTF